MKNINFHIDDYGILPSTDKYILSLIKLDKINSISIICNTKFSSYLITKLKKLINKKKISISCHINLTDFQVKKFRFNFINLLFYSIFPNREISKIIHKLVLDQINFFTKKIPIKNNTIYVDGHRHIHILPAVQTEIIKILKKKKIKYKFRNSNENFFLYLKLNFLNKLLMNYIKLFIIKLLYLLLNKKKNFFNDIFIGVIATGMQHKAIIIKCLKKLNLKNKQTAQILFHPLKISKIEIRKFKLNINDYEYYISEDRKCETNFFNSIVSKDSFIEENI